MKFFTLLLFSAFTTITLFSQKKQDRDIHQFINQATEAELITKSTALLSDGFYQDAEIVIDKLMTLQPESANYNYRKGFVIIVLRQDYEGAISYLTKASTKVHKNYDLYSLKEINASIDALYYLAKSYHFVHRLDEAKEMYNQFIEKSDKKSELVKFANLGLEQCAVADKFLKSPNNKVVIRNAGPKINSIYPEYSPIISLDGSGFYYTIRKPWQDNESDEYIEKKTGLYLEDIYASFLDDNQEWAEPVRLDFCRPDRNEATVAMNVEERIIYSYSDLSGGGDIYFSDFKEDQFETPEILNVKDLNTDAWESHLTISPKGDLMYFVSDRLGGFGGRDIYECKKLPDGNWSKPVNMGPKINSAYDEDSPFISADNQYFYFATNGNRSMGGFDIMYSKKNEDGSWGESVNIGYPLNTCGDDLYYTSTGDGYLGYFTSNRTGGYGEKDIYEVVNNYLGVENISFLKVKVNTIDNVPIPENYRVVLTCMDCPVVKEDIVYSRLRDGVILTSLESCRTYHLSYQMGEDQFVIYEETIKTECDVAFQEIERDQLIDVLNKKKVGVEKVEELPVVANKTIEATFFFKYNKNKLFVGNREFKKFMKEIEKQLEGNNEHIVVKIKSSASKVPTTKYKSNEELSQLRAEHIKYDIINFIEKNSDYSDRISTVIVESIVSGPDYENDKRNKEKYQPFQYAKVKTEN